MGQEHSSTNKNSKPPPNPNYTYVSLQVNQEESDELIQPHVSYEQRCNNKLLNVAFNGVWSVANTSISNSPCSRIGHFHSYDPLTGKEYIGYGLDSHENTLNDVWSIDLIERKWERVNITGYIPEPRTGASAVFSKGNIYIFGGYSKPNYFNDLHCINVNTGVCTKIETKGLIPTPRTSPLLGYYNKKMYVWGGFDRTFPTELYTLDFDTMTWTRKDTGLTGRTTAPYTIIDSDLYSYGASRASTVFHLDLKNGNIEEIHCIGACPPDTVQCAGMAATKEILFWFGGKTETDFGFVYAYDIKSSWWFIFQMRPDCESVSFNDGVIDEFGLFQIPQQWSYSMQYEHKTRELIGLFGFPMKEPPPIFIVGISEALGVIHLRDDMLSVIRQEFPKDT